MISQEELESAIAQWQTRQPGVPLPDASAVAAVDGDEMQYDAASYDAETPIYDADALVDIDTPTPLVEGDLDAGFAEEQRTAAGNELGARDAGISGEADAQDNDWNGDAATASAGDVLPHSGYSERALPRGADEPTVVRDANPSVTVDWDPDDEEDR